jgi:hypothetical protein
MPSHGPGSGFTRHSGATYWDAGLDEDDENWEVSPSCRDDEDAWELGVKVAKRRTRETGSDDLNNMFAI